MDGREPKVVEASKLGFNVFHRSEGSATERPGRNQGRLGSEPAIWSVSHNASCSLVTGSDVVVVKYVRKQ